MSDFEDGNDSSKMEHEGGDTESEISEPDEAKKEKDSIKGDPLKS